LFGVPNLRGERKMAISRTVRVMTMAAVAMTAAGQQLTNEAREAYLMTAKIVRSKGISMGVTNSAKAYMDDRHPGVPGCLYPD
jgi:hypothetical protein